jgi:N-acetylmuramoyl-L-alanine amidase
LVRWSPNRDARPAGSTVDTLILHYTGMPTAEDALARLGDPAAKVSAHYLIDEDGSIVQLVPEPERAWHAGVSVWRGETDLNARSIGIELVNPGHEWGYRPFTEAQYRALIPLCLEILQRWPIPPPRVLAHSDVAPDRKQDPGELFDWQRLACAGIGVWPEDGPGLPRSLDEVLAQLAEIGYPNAGRATITAFQRHFRPEHITGDSDPHTLARLDGVLRVP